MRAGRWKGFEGLILYVWLDVGYQKHPSFDLESQGNTDVLEEASGKKPFDHFEKWPLIMFVHVYDIANT